MSIAAAMMVIVDASWHASILAVLVLGFQFVGRRRIPARWRFALWLLVLVRLSAVPLPESRLSVFNWVPSPAGQLQVQAAGGDSVHIVPAAGKGRAMPVETMGHRSIAWGEIFAAVYAAGVTILLGRMGIATWSLRRVVRGAERVEDAGWLTALAGARETLGIARKIPVLVTDRLASPALVGMWRPKLLVPRGVIGALSVQEMRFVCLHECAHLRRHDILVNYWLAVLGAVHWFNPVVWMLLPRIRADRELACDEHVMLHAGDAARYGQTLLKLLETPGLGGVRGAPAAIGMIEKKAFFKRRIHMIAAFRRPPTWIGIPAMGMLVMIATATLTSAISVAAVEMGAVPAVVHFTTAVPAQPEAAKKVLEMNVPQLACDGEGFEKVISFLGDSLKLNIVVNWKALADHGVDKNTPITAKVTTVPLRKALSIVLEQTGGNLAYTFEDNVLTISSSDDLAKSVIPTKGETTLHVYNVRDLLNKASGTLDPATGMPGTPATEGAPVSEDDMGRLEQVIIATVEPASWNMNGSGVSSMQAFHGLLTVTTTAEIHQKIADLLENLRAADKEGKH